MNRAEPPPTAPRLPRIVRAAAAMVAAGLVAWSVQRLNVSGYWDADQERLLVGWPLVWSHTYLLPHMTYAQDRSWAPLVFNCGVALLLVVGTLRAMLRMDVGRQPPQVSLAALLLAPVAVALVCLSFWERALTHPYEFACGAGVLLGVYATLLEMPTWVKRRAPGGGRRSLGGQRLRRR